MDPCEQSFPNNGYCLYSDFMDCLDALDETHSKLKKEPVCQCRVTTYQEATENVNACSDKKKRRLLKLKQEYVVHVAEWKRLDAMIRSQYNKMAAPKTTLTNEEVSRCETCNPNPVSRCETSFPNNGTDLYFEFVESLGYLEDNYPYKELKKIHVCQCRETAFIKAIKNVTLCSDEEKWALVNLQNKIVVNIGKWKKIDAELRSQFNKMATPKAVSITLDETTLPNTDKKDTTVAPTYTDETPTNTDDKDDAVAPTNTDEKDTTVGPPTPMEEDKKVGPVTTDDDDGIPSWAQETRIIG